VAIYRAVERFYDRFYLYNCISVIEVDQACIW